MSARVHSRHANAGKPPLLTTLCLEGRVARVIGVDCASAEDALSKVHSFWMVLAATPACLYPPARVVQARRASAAAAQAAPQDNAGDVPAPAKPKGPLISDGTVTTVMNLEPGGGWFMFHDPTP